MQFLKRKATLQTVRIHRPIPHIVNLVVRCEELAPNVVAPGAAVHPRTSNMVHCYCIPWQIWFNFIAYCNTMTMVPITTFFINLLLTYSQWRMIISFFTWDEGYLPEGYVVYRYLFIPLHAESLLYRPPRMSWSIKSNREQVHRGAAASRDNNTDPRRQRLPSGVELFPSPSFPPIRCQ